MQLVWELDPETQARRVVEFRKPTITLGELDSAIIITRPFFLMREDAYLPKVVDAVMVLSDAEHAAAIKQNSLPDFVAQFVVGDRLVGGGFVHSGRLEMDNEAGVPGQLLSSGQIAMDYIYGVALHEDDNRIRRLTYTSGDSTALLATAQELHHLMRAVATVREQIRSSADNGHFSIGIQVGAPSPLAMINGPDAPGVRRR